MIDIYFIGYSRSASTTIELAMHKHPQIQQSYKMRIFVRDSIYYYKLNEALSLYKKDDRTIIESDEELIGNDLMGDYRFILERAKKHNPDLKIIVSIRNQKTHIPSEYIIDLISKVGFLTFKNWINTPRGHVVFKSNYYYERILNLYRIFGKENVHIIVFENFVQDTQKELNKMFDFIGVNRIDKSFIISKNNPSPSLISILLMSYFNKTLNFIRILKNFRSTLSVPQNSKYFELNISSLKRCIDNEHSILKSYYKYRTNLYTMKYLYIPFLEKIDEKLNLIYKKLKLKYIRKIYMEEIAKAYYDDNRKLEELIDVDLGKYNY